MGTIFFYLLNCVFCHHLLYLEMMHGIERRLFADSGKKGKSPVYSMCDLKNGFYRFALFPSYLHYAV